MVMFPEVLLWIKSVILECGENVTTEQLKDYIWKTLNSGKVVPGFGHGLLHNTDPRYLCQREFALKHLPDDPLFQLVSKLFEVVPPILTELGKIAEEVMPPAPIANALIMLAKVLPKAKLVPKQDLAEMAFRDVNKRKLIACGPSDKDSESCDVRHPNDTL